MALDSVKDIMLPLDDYAVVGEDASMLDALRALPETEREQHRLYIDPQECVHCGACQAVCPQRAVFEDYGIPPEWEPSLEENAAFFEERPRESGRRRWRLRGA